MDSIFRLQVNYEAFTEEFCQSKGWSDWDRRSWRDLTKQPSIILTDMADYFQVSNSLPYTAAAVLSLQTSAAAQNHKVEPIPAKTAKKLVAPVNLTMFRHAAPRGKQQQSASESAEDSTGAPAAAVSAAPTSSAGAGQAMER
jgi:hypothetical protein